MRYTSRWLQGYFVTLLVCALIILCGAIIQHLSFVLGGVALLVTATVIAAGVAVVLHIRK